MNQGVAECDMRKKEKTAAVEMNILQNGRFATLLFIIGSLVTLVEYDESQKVILETLSNKSGKSGRSKSEVNAAELAEIAGIMFVVAVSIYAVNALTTLKIQKDNLKSGSNIKIKRSSIITVKGWEFVAFFDLLKVIAFAGVAVGYHINTIAAKKG